jgi:Ca2+-binding EF-hand superfamily protein
MGACIPRGSLTPEIKQLAVDIFNEIDSDGSKFIDINETLKFWSKNYAKINSQAMFRAVDKDENQKIDLKEWKSFWLKVKRSGHTDDEIKEELLNIRNRGSWVQFVNVPDAHKEKRID